MVAGRGLTWVAVVMVSWCGLSWCGVSWWAMSPAGAHTTTDLVAVPAGARATVTLRPTHGCGSSPTVAVVIRAPVTGAAAGEVPGWTTDALPDGDGNTVLEWTGSSLPADAAGAFPVTFAVPDAVGELLVFPAVQRCADGSELAWISGDPRAQFPAPRLLVLPPGASAAASIDDVGADTPGRDQLVEIVDVDGATTVPATTVPATTVPATTVPATTVPATTVPATTAAASSVEPDRGGEATDGVGLGPWVVGGAVGLVGALLFRRYRNARDARNDTDA